MIVLTLCVTLGLALRSREQTGRVCRSSVKPKIRTTCPARSQRTLFLQSRPSARGRPTRTGSGSIPPLRVGQTTGEVAHNLFTLVRGRSRRVLSTKSVVPHRQIGSGSIPPLHKGKYLRISFPEGNRPTLRKDVGGWNSKMVMQPLSWMVNLTS